MMKRENGVADTKMVREHIDTVDALMENYVAGSLPEPVRVLVAAHLEMKSDDSLLVHDLYRLAGEALEQLAPAPLGDRDGRLAAIFESVLPKEPAEPMVGHDGRSPFPCVLRDFIGYDIEDVPWRTKIPGFREYAMGDIDGCTVSLMWARAGRVLPAHTHGGIELTLVIDGAFHDFRGRFGPGDISIADDSVDHRPVAEGDRPCIAFSVMDAPIR